MTVRELNRDQLVELKQQYLIDTSVDGNVSYDELANADELVSDQEIIKVSRHIDFSPDDFASSSGEDYDDTCRVVIEGANKHDIAYDLQYVADQIESGYTNGILSDGATWYIE